MLNNNKIDLVESALKQFTNYIVNKKIGINSEENIVHLLECVGELRKGCEQQKE